MNQMDLIILQLLVMHTYYTNSQPALFNIMPTLCTCPGTDLTYECTIMDEHGSGATVWTGTAFNCSETEDKLTLLHIRDRFSSIIRGCNDDAISGHGIRIDGNRYYTSQLNIIVDSYMDGKSVECFYDRNIVGETLVGNSTIMITSVPFPPPTDITFNITDVTNGSLQLAFKWTPVAPNCSDIGYIITNDCGYCPKTTFDTEVVCTDVMIGSQCSFTFQTRVCDSLIGNMSIVTLTLKIPDAPVVSVIPSYGHKTGSLTRVIMQFNESERFDIFGELSGSTIYYSISFTDVDSGVVCGSTNISASSCMEGICKYTYHFSSRACLNSESIIMNILATNVLGSGNPYNTTIGFINSFVKVNFNANFTQATCKLIYKIRLNCTFVYESQGDNSQSLITSTLMGTSQTDTVIFNLDTLPNVNYYFTATASSGRDTAVVEGTFTSLRQTESDVMNLFVVSGYVFWGVVGAMGIVMITVTITATFTVATSLRRISKLSQREQSTERLELENRQSSFQINTERNIAYETILGVVQDSRQ